MRTVVVSLFIVNVLAAQGPGPDLKKMQGLWRATLLEVDGRPASADERKVEIHLRVTGDKYAVLFEDKEVAGGTLQLDPGMKPPALDAAEASGPNAGKTRPGIYAFDGDEMKICFAHPGQPRPTEFATRKGSMQVLIRYQRVGK